MSLLGIVMIGGYRKKKENPVNVGLGPLHSGERASPLHLCVFARVVTRDGPGALPTPALAWVLRGRGVRWPSLQSGLGVWCGQGRRPGLPMPVCPETHLNSCQLLWAEMSFSPLYNRL